MRLIEHEARGQLALALAGIGVARRLDHHQRVVGDHDGRRARAPLGPLDEAGAIVRARGVDAFAASISKPQGAARAEQIGEPGREVAALNIAVARRHDPARDEPERDAIRRQKRAPVHRFVIVEETKIVLAALADHHRLGLGRGIGIEPVELTIDLALEILRVGREPDRALIALGPEARGREIAERLADAGAGLGNHDVRLARRLARLKRGRDRRGVVRLLRPVLGRRANQGREPPARVRDRHAEMIGRRLRRLILPLRKPVPHRERADVASRGIALQRGPRATGHERREHRRSPQPAGTRHERRELHRLGRRAHGLAKARKQRFRRNDQKRGFVLEAPGLSEPKRQRKAARGRQAEARRLDEREQLEQIARGERLHADATRHHPRVADQRRRLGLGKARGGLRRVQRDQLALAVEPQRTPQAHREGGTGDGDGRCEFGHRHEYRADRSLPRHSGGVCAEQARSPLFQ